MIGSDAGGISDEVVRAARRAYYACVSHVDGLVGRLLAAVDDDTVVVFTADHGEMLGERGLWYKMSFFEDSARVPLIAAGPGVGSARVAAPVSLLDLAPTLAELAGAETAGHGFEGSSLAAGRRLTGRCASTWPRARRRRR